MADLRITGVMNNQLELQAPDGTRHYLEISDDLLKAMKSRPTSLPKNLTPRDIQTEIRLGVSVQELVARTGADEDHVTKYAAPIVTELNHIVTLARNIRLSVAGDRFADPTQIEFGAVMDERLKANSATNINWSSRKSLEGNWLVSVDYLLRGAKGIATWSFDPKKLLLVPETQSAIQLSNSVALTISDDTKIERIEHVHPTTNFSSPETHEEPLSATAALSVVPELIEVEVSEEETTTEIIAVIETEIKSFRIVEDPLPETDQEEAQSQETAMTEESVQVEEQPIEPDGPKTTEETHTPSKNQSTSRWAEVLFGSKDEDEQ